jgi:hypothetical protein
MSLQSIISRSHPVVHPPKASAIGCENGRHSAISSSKTEINGVVHAVCRHCGCELMRLGASRRWFRTGQLG